MDARYQQVKDSGVLKQGCPLCAAPSIAAFDHWRIIDNAYPYDLIAKVHHMIVPKRHASDGQLSEEEWKEFAELKRSYVEEHYEFVVEPTQRQKSIPEHTHIHLLVSKYVV